MEQHHTSDVWKPTTLDDLHRLLASVRVKLNTACGLTVQQYAPTDQQNDHFIGFMNSGSFIKIFVCDETQAKALDHAEQRNKDAYKLGMRLREKAQYATEEEQEHMSMLKELTDSYTTANTPELGTRLREMTRTVTEENKVRKSKLAELQDLYVQVSANTTHINYLRYWMKLEAQSVHAMLMSQHASDVWRDLPVIDSGFGDMQF